MISNLAIRAGIRFRCPSCLPGAVPLIPEERGLCCPQCEHVWQGGQGYYDLVGDTCDQTDEHYTLQWGREKGFRNFLKERPAAKTITPGGQLGWEELFREIRGRAQGGAQPVWVYDAACGFGGIAGELINDETKDNLVYVGADIHHALPEILQDIPALRLCGVLVRWDISRPLPVTGKFDYVICRAAIHHTPDPHLTFDALCSLLKPGGRLALSVYRKKGPAREALDDCYREQIIPLPVQEAYALSRQFMLLGKYLQRISEEVVVEEDLPLFNIRQGTYSVQALFYNHFLKCFYNPVFGDEYSTLVNFDWYHPPFAFRYEADEVRAWFQEKELKLIHSEGIEAQIYFLGEKVA